MKTKWRACHFKSVELGPCWQSPDDQRVTWCTMEEKAKLNRGKCHDHIVLSGDSGIKISPPPSTVCYRAASIGVENKREVLFTNIRQSNADKLHKGEVTFSRCIAVWQDKGPEQSGINHPPRAVKLHPWYSDWKLCKQQTVFNAELKTEMEAILATLCHFYYFPGLQAFVFGNFVRFMPCT